MDQILKGMTKCITVLMTSLSEQIAMNTCKYCMGELLIRLERQGILANKSKCEFMVLSVKFLDYRVDGEGQHPKDEKIAALSKAPSPKKKGEKKGRTPLLLCVAELLWKFYS